MTELEYSLIIEATGDSGIFGFYSPDLEGFAGISCYMRIGYRNFSLPTKDSKYTKLYSLC